MNDEGQEEEIEEGKGIGIDNIFFIPKKADTLTRLVNHKGEEFTRNSDTGAYFNHDEEYTKGTLYMLIKGANSIPGELNTYIPVPLRSSNLNQIVAEIGSKLILDLADKLSDLKNVDWKTKKANKEFKEIINNLKKFLIVDLDTKPSDINADFF